MGDFLAYFRSDTETPDTDYLGQSVSYLQRMEGELLKLAQTCENQMTYRSEARPDATFNPPPFAKPTTDTLPQMDQCRPHVFDVTQTLDNVIYQSIIFWH